jgi:PEP-CTERM motif
MIRLNAKSALLAIGVAGFLASGLTAPASAGVLYDNLGETSQGAAAMSGNPADSFSTGSSGFLLRDVKMLLGLNGGSGAGRFQVYVFDNVANAPSGAGIRLGGTFTPSDLSPTVGVFDISLTTPVALLADTRYWIEIKPRANPGFWFYDSDASGTGVAGEYWYLNGTTNPNSTGPFQMQLSGTAMPEPASLALLGFGFAGLGLIRRRA